MVTPCFRANGTRDATLFACNPADNISPCCRVTDLCLSNGLCLNLGSDGNNAYSTQGCTDPTWPSPCLSRCGTKMLDSGKDMWPYHVTCCSCNTVSAYTLPEYCCWRGEMCCNWPETRFQLPLFRAASRPGGIPGSVPTNSPPTEDKNESSSPGTKPPSTNSETSIISGAGAQTTYNAPVYSINNGDDQQNHTVLGLGLLLFALAVSFFAVQLRRKRKSMRASNSKMLGESIQDLTDMSTADSRLGAGASHSMASVAIGEAELHHGSIINLDVQDNTNTIHPSDHTIPHGDVHTNSSVPRDTGSAPATITIQPRQPGVQSAIMLPTEPAAAELPVPSNNRFAYMFS